MSRRAGLSRPVLDTVGGALHAADASPQGWMIIRRPSCGDSRVKQLPNTGDRDDYDCVVCHAVSLSGTDRAAIANGAPSHTVPDASGRVWPRPHEQADLITRSGTFSAAPGLDWL